MSGQISLKEVENNMFKSAFGDGLLDIFIGSFFLMFAVAPFLSANLGDFWSSAVFVPFWAANFLVLYWIRRTVVRPRIGNVKYGPWRKSRMLRFNVVMVVVLTISLMLGFLSVYRFDAVPGWVHTARFSFVVLITFSAAAYFLGLNRLYLYGILIALAPLIGELLWVYLEVPHHGYPVTYGFVSLFMIIVGVALLLRLVRSHPIEPMPPTARKMAE